MYVNTCVRKLLQPLTIASALSSYFLQQNSNLRDEPTAITEIVMNVYRRPTGAPDNAGLHFGHTAQFFFHRAKYPPFRVPVSQRSVKRWINKTKQRSVSKPKTYQAATSALHIISKSLLL